jgi:general secretion pathway protein F
MSLFEYQAADHSGTLGKDEITNFVHAVSAAAASRVPLEVTLAVLAEERDDPRLADVAHRLAAELQQGATMEQAVAALEHELPAEVRGLLRAGIECGDPAGTFERFTQQRMVSQRIARRIGAAIAYPLIVLAILVPLVLFLSWFVIPIFGEFFHDFDAVLPGITELILETANQMPALVAGLLVLCLAVPMVMRIVGGRWLFHRVRAALPLVGRLWMWSAQREFAALLASFLELRLPIASAVRHTGEIMSDRNLAGACRRVAQRLETAQPLSDSLAQSMHFDPSLIAFVAWGERHGLLPDALRIAADVFEDRVEQHASLLHRLLPPIVMVAVAAIVVLVIIALMVPMTELIRSLMV